MKQHATHPGLKATPLVTLPPNVIVCSCGLHYMVRGQRINRTHCRWLQRKDER